MLKGFLYRNTNVAIGLFERTGACLLQITERTLLVQIEMRKEEKININITLTDENKVAFFNNAAGIGFDAFVVKNLSLYRKWGSLAYLVAALSSFSSFKKSQISYSMDSVKMNSYIFLFSIPFPFTIFEQRSYSGSINLEFTIFLFRVLLTK